MSQSRDAKLYTYLKRERESYVIHNGRAMVGYCFILEEREIKKEIGLQTSPTGSERERYYASYIMEERDYFRSYFVYQSQILLKVLNTLFGTHSPV